MKAAVKQDPFQLIFCKQLSIEYASFHICES